MFLTFLNFPGLFGPIHISDKSHYFGLRNCVIRPRALNILRREIQKGQKHWRPDFLKVIVLSIKKGFDLLRCRKAFLSEGALRIPTAIIQASNEEILKKLSFWIRGLFLLYPKKYLRVVIILVGQKFHCFTMLLSMGIILNSN